MSETRRSLPMPPEPYALRAETRALLEERPEDGMKTINDARFVAETLWEEWGDGLEEAGMPYDTFLTIARGYAGELRLWVVGERIWEHCAAGLAGRVTRRLPDAGCGKQLASAGASR
ncbi:hypothetical protein GBA65_08920 [Rubrobacter marinus]|uniref:Uncharacterized protein n=1 Tax=Rubrobacter marinus TaxID=2653852 RepID=A0A6G8PWP6_9ACTN|nr:hypothetical protein [Rubrobacter marinus]QIN78622.1 hypothetical protein GBA65_08920 [Rubrobacter marinus]